MKKYLPLFAAPFFILCFALGVGLIWKLFNLPTNEELLELIRTAFDTYGIALVFVSAVLESAFVLGVYAPGGLVIFLGVIFSIGDPARASLVVLSVIVGFMIGFSIDYILGRYGWYRFLLHFGFKKALESTKERVQKYGLSIPWLGYHNPDLGSLIATTYGILQYPYIKFFNRTILPVIAWCTFWGVTAYILGNEALKIMGYKTLFIILGVWIIARIIETKVIEKRKQKMV